MRWHDRIDVDYCIIINGVIMPYAIKWNNGMCIAVVNSATEAAEINLNVCIGLAKIVKIPDISLLSYQVLTV